MEFGDKLIIWHMYRDAKDFCLEFVRQSKHCWIHLRYILKAGWVIIEFPRRNKATGATGDVFLHRQQPRGMAGLDHDCFQ